MKQIRVTECRGCCSSSAKKLCLGSWQNVRRETDASISFDHPPEIVAQGGLAMGCSISKGKTYELRDAPDSMREEVSEVLALYHVIAWQKDKNGDRKALAYSNELEAESDGNAKVKAVLDRAGWEEKNTEDPDDYIWQVIEVK